MAELNGESEQSQTPAPEPGTPEYDAAMIARADQTGSSQSEDQTGQPASEPETDDLILGKFKSQEDLAAAYVELQKKLGAPKKDGEAGEPSLQLGGKDDSSDETDDKSGDSSTDDDSAGDAPAVDFNKYAESYATNGELTEADRTELEKAGISQAMQDVYLAGLKSMHDTRMSAATEAAGGEEQFNAIQEWAAESLTDGEIAAFNKQLTAAQSAEDVSLIYATLATRYAKANQQEPSLLNGDGGNSNNTTTGFASRKEMTTAMSDDRYQHDPAYRAQIAKRVGATSWL